MFYLFLWVYGNILVYYVKKQRSFTLKKKNIRLFTFLVGLFNTLYVYCFSAAGDKTWLHAGCNWMQSDYTLGLQIYCSRVYIQSALKLQWAVGLHLKCRPSDWSVRNKWGEGKNNQTKSISFRLFQYRPWILNVYVTKSKLAYIIIWQSSVALVYTLTHPFYFDN